MNLTSLLAFTAKMESAYAAACQSVLNEFSLSKTSLDILMFLSNNPGLYTAKDICLYRNIKPNVVSQHVDRLVREGYLRRQSVHGDRRMIRLVCTERAQPIVEQGLAVQQGYLNALVEGLTEEDLAGFRHCFRVMGENAHRLQNGTIESSTEGISK